MTYTLINHDRGYNLTIAQAFCSVATLTALNYGKRHREMAQMQPSNWLGHTVLFVAHCIPIIGIIVATIEHLAASYFLRIQSPSKAASLINRLNILTSSSHKPLPSRIEPMPAPEPAPEPVVEPEPVSEPTPAPEPVPEPIPEPKSTPEPTPPHLAPDPEPEPIPPLPANFTTLAELLRETEDYFNHFVAPAPLTFPDINMQGMSCSNLLKILLEKYEGICIGEAHASSSPKYFLTVNMPLFKQLGVTTLYLEGYGGMQEVLDTYFAGETEDLPLALKQHIARFPAPNFKEHYSECDVLIAAKRAKVRMCNIDSPAANIARTGGIERVAAMNYQAKLLIDQDRAANPGGKSIIYAGCAHTCRVGGVPSLGQIYQFPSIYLKDRADAYCFGANATTIPAHSIQKEIVEKIIINGREYNVDFVISMDAPIK